MTDDRANELIEGALRLVPGGVLGFKAYKDSFEFEKQAVSVADLIEGASNGMRRPEIGILGELPLIGVAAHALLRF